MITKPSLELWRKINIAIYGENTAEVITTMIAGLCTILCQAGVTDSEAQARAHLAAVLLSPEADAPGSLMPLLQTELDRLTEQDNKVN